MKTNISPNVTQDNTKVSNMNDALNLETFHRKTFPVQAVQVTDANIAAAAKWCNGEIKDDHGKPYIQGKVHNAMNDRQTRAYVGDWILDNGRNSFKFYTRQAFDRSFAREEVKNTTVNVFNNPSTEPGATGPSTINHDSGFPHVGGSANPGGTHAS